MRCVPQRLRSGRERQSTSVRPRLPRALHRQGSPTFGTNNVWARDWLHTTVLRHRLPLYLRTTRAPQWLVDTVLEHRNRLPTCPLCKSIALPRVQPPRVSTASDQNALRTPGSAPSTTDVTDPGGAAGIDLAGIQLRLQAIELRVGERERMEQERLAHERLFGRPPSSVAAPAAPADTFVQNLFGAAATPPRFSEAPQPTASAGSTADRTWPDVAE